MTANLDLDAVRSRRSILAAGAAGAAGLLAAAVARPAVTNAATGDSLVIGKANTADDVTTITNLTSADAALEVYGKNGVGLSGRSDVSTGVYWLGLVNGVIGDASGMGCTAVLGRNANGPAVGAESKKGPALMASTATDQYPAVQAYNPSGEAVRGTSESPATSAVLGSNAGGGIGVHGASATGVGVRAESIYNVALQVSGKATFSRSGRKIIATGQSSLVVTMAGVTSASWILATLQTNRSGVFVRAVVPATGKFTIYLNKALTASAAVGFLVVN